MHLTTLALMVVSCICYNPEPFASGVTLEDKVSAIAIRSLEQLCQGVDICNPNATGPHVERNKILDGQFVSRCYGCSCHADCRDLLTCCFPDDSDLLPNHTANTTLDTNRFVNWTTIPTVTERYPDSTSTTSEDGEDTPQAERGPIVNTDGTVSTPSDETVSRMQCLYARVGTPGETWINEVPSYRMVSRPPTGGCKIQGVRTDPCDNFLPVYSNQHNTFYKNELCARCHGATDSNHWKAILVCDKYDTTFRTIPVSEHFDFLQGNSSPSHCFLTFDYDDLNILRDNRCFLDTNSTCPFSPDGEAFQIPDGLNLTHEEITTACHSGINSPIPIHLSNTVYRNVFCAICNNDVKFLHYLRDRYDSPFSRGIGTEKTTYLLDTSFLKDTVDVKKTKLPTTYPEVCLRNENEWIKESCRELYCPSGQVRNKKGICKFPSKRWGQDSLTYTTKLRYASPNTTIQELIDAGQVSSDTWRDVFRENTPWSSRWTINRIMHSTNDSPEPMVVVVLITRMTNPAAILYDIRKAMSQTWNVSVNGFIMQFEQSMFEYLFIHVTFPVPSWTPFVDELDKGHYLSNVSSMTWRFVYVDYGMFVIPTDIRKSFTCEQVSLFDNEYTLMLNNLVLKNKLTDEIMFEIEFDLHVGQNGRLFPRVCLSDTPLTLRADVSAAPNNNQITNLLSGFILYFVFRKVYDYYF